MRARLGTAGLGALLAGCAGLAGPGHPPVPDLSQVAVRDVPFVAQSRYQCGPASLAMVLHHAGVDVALEELTQAVFLPGRRGSLQLELRAAARRHARLPYEPAGSPWPALAASLSAGYPALVLLDQGILGVSRWHYAVVTGLPEGAVRLHSGTQPDRVMRRAKFARQWAGSGHWFMLVARPQEIPGFISEQDFVAAAAVAEERSPRLAVLAYATGLQRWPESPAVRFGLASSHLRLGEFAAAEATLRGLAAGRPRHPAVENNLALALAGLGRWQDAEWRLVEQLRRTPLDDPWHPTLADSYRQIRERRLAL